MNLLSYERAVEQSSKLKTDRYYTLSPDIESFLQEVRKTLPVPFTIEPQTLNRSLSLFKDGIFITGIDYEGIYDSPLFCMARITEIVNDSPD